jgi:hypothetical protein
LTGGLLKIWADFEHFRPKSGFLKNRFYGKSIVFKFLSPVFPSQLFSDGLKYRVDIEVLVFHRSHFQPQKPVEMLERRLYRDGLDPYSLRLDSQLQGHAACPDIKDASVTARSRT